METSTDEMISQETGPTLQLKRPLLPIDEYAAREGVSRGIVEECGKLGIVQIRKYKGKTFVVDVPLSPYPHISDTTTEPIQPVDKTAQAKNISELVQKVIPDTLETTEEHTKSGDESVKAGTISQLVKRMFHKASQTTDKLAETTNGETGQTENIPEPIQITPPEPLKIITDEPTAEADEISQAENPSEPIQTPELQTLEITDEPSELIDETAETKETPKSAQIIQDSGIQFGLLTAQARSKRTWQIAAVFSTAFLFTALFGNLWFYMDRKIQIDRIDQAYASIQQFLNKSTQAKQQVKTLQNKLVRSQAELKTVQSELAQARQNLKTIQERNAQAVERLNQQIQKLTGQLSELTKNRQTVSDSSISGK